MTAASRSAKLVSTSARKASASLGRLGRIHLAAQQHELAEDRAEGLAVIAAEISDRLEVRLQMPQQPDYLDVAMGLGFQAPAGSNVVQIAVDVELQQIGRIVARPAGPLRSNADKAGCGQI